MVWKESGKWKTANDTEGVAYNTKRQAKVRAKFLKMKGHDESVRREVHEAIENEEFAVHHSQINW